MRVWQRCTEFKDLGFNVSAFDPSIEMVKAAIKLTGLQIAQMTFEEISLAQKHDGIWACASLLHVERKNLKNVMINLAKSLNEGGVIYSSFKYGETERQKGERYFNDMNEALLKEIISDFQSIKFTEAWVSRDARKNPSSGSWLNCILTRFNSWPLRRCYACFRPYPRRTPHIRSYDI